MQNLGDITAFLNRNQALNRDQWDHLFEMLYPEVKKIANQQLNKIIRTAELTPTVLVNECYLKLKSSAGVDLQNRKHFYGVVSRCMRFHLIDMVRKQYRSIQPSADTQFSVTQIAVEETEVDLLALGHALERLENIDKALMDIVDLRFFGGFSLEEVAELYDSNKSQIYRQWQLAQSILANLMDENSDDT